MMTSSPAELEDSFYKNLEFGTGGMRGVMGPGTNRINKYTLGKNTQGISDYLKTSFPNEPLKVVIAYDCRHNSDTLAKVVADVFSANGIHVYLFSDLRPTPELSFALKYLNCHAGIVLTASPTRSLSGSVPTTISAFIFSAKAVAIAKASGSSGFGDFTVGKFPSGTSCSATIFTFL